MANYIGNNDFRGWVAKQAPDLLGYVGNDYNPDPSIATGFNLQKWNANNKGVGQISALQRLNKIYKNYSSQGASTIGSPTDYTAGYGYQAPARAASFDVAGTYKQAYKQAAKEVNPLYDKLLNNFLATQKIQRKAQENLYNTTTAELEANLHNTLGGNQLTRSRTAEDTAFAQGQIDTQQDQFQTDSGDKFAEERIQIASEKAKAGLTGGLGAQANEKAEATRNTTEGRIVDQARVEKERNEISKIRTFEDLARSDVFTSEKTARGKASAKFDLDNWIEEAKKKEEKERIENKMKRAEHIKLSGKAIASEKYAKFLTGIGDARTVNATADKYGAFF